MDHYEGKYTRLIYNEIQFLASYILVFWFSDFNPVMHTLVFNFQISTISCNNLYSIISDTYVPKFLNFSMLHNESHDWLCTISGTKVYLTTNVPNVPSTTGTPIIHTVHGTKMYSSSTVLINTITLSKSTSIILTQCFIIQNFDHIGAHSGPIPPRKCSSDLISKSSPDVSLWYTSLCFIINTIQSFQASITVRFSRNTAKKISKLG